VRRKTLNFALTLNNVTKSKVLLLWILGSERTHAQVDGKASGKDDLLFQWLKAKWQQSWRLRSTKLTLGSLPALKTEEHWGKLTKDLHDLTRDAPLMIQYKGANPGTTPSVAPEQWQPDSNTDGNVITTPIEGRVYPSRLLLSSFARSFPRKRKQPDRFTPPSSARATTKTGGRGRKSRKSSTTTRSTASALQLGPHGVQQPDEEVFRVLLQGRRRSEFKIGDKLRTCLANSRVYILDRDTTFQQVDAEYRATVFQVSFEGVVKPVPGTVTTIPIDRSPMFKSSDLFELENIPPLIDLGGGVAKAHSSLGRRQELKSTDLPDENTTATDIKEAFEKGLVRTGSSVLGISMAHMDLTTLWGPSVDGNSQSRRMKEAVAGAAKASFEFMSDKWPTQGMSGDEQLDQTLKTMLNNVAFLGHENHAAYLKCGEASCTTLHTEVAGCASENHLLRHSTHSGETRGVIIWITCWYNELVDAIRKDASGKQGIAETQFTKQISRAVDERLANIRAICDPAVLLEVLVGYSVDVFILKQRPGDTVYSSETLRQDGTTRIGAHAVFGGGSGAERTFAVAWNRKIHTRHLKLTLMYHTRQGLTAGIHGGNCSEMTERMVPVSFLQDKLDRLNQVPGAESTHCLGHVARTKASIDRLLAITWPDNHRSYQEGESVRACYLSGADSGQATLPVHHCGLFSDLRSLCGECYPRFYMQGQLVGLIRSKYMPADCGQDVQTCADCEDAVSGGHWASIDAFMKALRKLRLEAANRSNRGEEVQPMEVEGDVAVGREETEPCQAAQPMQADSVSLVRQDQIAGAVVACEPVREARETAGLAAVAPAAGGEEARSCAWTDDVEREVAKSLGQVGFTVIGDSNFESFFEIGDSKGKGRGLFFKGKHSKKVAIVAYGGRHRKEVTEEPVTGHLVHWARFKDRESTMWVNADEHYTGLFNTHDNQEILHGNHFQLMDAQGEQDLKQLLKATEINLEPKHWRLLRSCLFGTGGSCVSQDSVGREFGFSQWDNGDEALMAYGPDYRIPCHEKVETFVTLATTPGNLDLKQGTNSCFMVAAIKALSACGLLPGLAKALKAGNRKDVNNAIAGMFKNMHETGPCP
jgi:hypothetical protein